MIAEANKAIILARKHVAKDQMNESSARFCLAEALNAVEREDYDAAHRWAVKSLAYSVGIFHPDHTAAA
jgi:hypothetical protein